MSLGVLDGSEGFPDRFGPEKGVVEYVPTRQPSLDEYRHPATPRNLRRTMSTGQAMTFLARELAK